MTNQYVKYKRLDLWTSDPIMTNQYVKYEDFVIKSFQGTVFLEKISRILS
jgi:hypothetical protein